ncbi:MAG: DUF4214 domain-containing protein [Verrucomicrobia bacterium]|nr:DUF4214 domain-containing protein [Verrucomicrobiota bacterium]
MHPIANRLAHRVTGCIASCLAGVGLVAGQTSVSPDRVTFYTEPNFRGDALTVEAGASIATLDSVKRPDRRPWTFGISSVRVEGAARATVYSAPGFRGDRIEIGASIADLYAVPRSDDSGASWDRSIVSVVVTGPRPMAPAPPPVRYEQPPTTVYVVPSPGPPPVVRQVRPLYNSRTADLVIDRAYRDVLGRGADPDGLRHYREKLLREGWTERLMIEDLQQSREARAINPDEAIARAYREVLGREPDPNGLNHYRQQWRKGWTQGQIREDLRRSSEGREASIRPTIARVYRELLGREVDPGGYATYEKLMREKGWGERELRQAIMAGDEYRKLRGRR